MSLKERGIAMINQKKRMIPLICYITGGKETKLAKLKIKYLIFRVRTVPNIQYRIAKLLLKLHLKADH